MTAGDLDSNGASAESNKNSKLTVDSTVTAS